jgi:hypothetical protein
MSPSKPPALATWLLDLTDYSAWNDAVAGDLFEEYQRRRSSAWYWRQVWTAVAIAVVRDVRQHWALACRALAAAFLLLSISHALVTEMGLVGWLLRHTNPLIGWWPSLTIVAALEAFLTCAPAGLAVALTHRKRQATMVLVYAAGLFAVLVCLCVNRAHWTLECMLFWEAAVFALLGALVGGFLGCAWVHPPPRYRTEIPNATAFPRK